MGCHARRAKGFAWDAALPKFEANEKPIATRAASRQGSCRARSHLPGLIGGSADLAPSNNTFLKGFGEFKKDKGRTSISESGSTLWAPF